MIPCGLLTASSSSSSNIIDGARQFDSIPKGKKGKSSCRRKKMGGMMFQLFTSASLLTLGFYHLLCSFFHLMKNPNSFSARPFYPFPLPSSNPNPNRLHTLPFFLLIFSLLFAFLHQSLLSFSFDPLVKGSSPVHRFSSLNSAAVIFLFLLIALALLLSEFPSFFSLPSDLLFALFSAAFFLHFCAASSSASFQTSDLQSHCYSLSARISALCSLLCLVLACRPRLFVADASLAAAICLHGLWQLQVGLSLYVDAFIPEGCHRLLDVESGVEGSTKCDLQESNLRAVAVLDLMFAIHVVLVVVILLITHVIIAKGVGMRRMGSYEALPTNSTDSNHIQMKALTGTQA